MYRYRYTYPPSESRSSSGVSDSGGFLDADADAAAILNKVIHAMRGMGAVADAAATIKVQLVDADELARAAAKRHRGPNASGPRGVTRTSVAY